MGVGQKQIVWVNSFVSPSVLSAIRAVVIHLNSRSVRSEIVRPSVGASERRRPEKRRVAVSIASIPIALASFQPRHARRRPTRTRLDISDRAHPRVQRYGFPQPKPLHVSSHRGFNRRVASCVMTYLTATHRRRRHLRRSRIPNPRRRVRRPRAQRRRRQTRCRNHLAQMQSNQNNSETLVRLTWRTAGRRS